MITRNILIIILIPLFLIFGAYFGYRYLFKPVPQEEIKEETKEGVFTVTEIEFLDSLSNPDFKEQDILPKDIEELNSLSSKQKERSQEEELQLLDSLRAL